MRGAGLIVALVALPATIPAAEARAQTLVEGNPGVLDGGEPDSRTGNGPLIDFGIRPTDDPRIRQACSFALPICVHAPRSAAVEPRTLVDTLGSAESAWWTLTGPLALPSPDLDLQTGALDIYLDEHVEGLADAILDRRDPVSAFDRASSFLRVDLHARACERDAAIARALARASLWRTTPATDDATARAESAYLARLAVPCAMSLVTGIDDFQNRPERAIPDAALGEEHELGAALFYWWLDYSFGTEPASTTQALWALAPTRTAHGSLHWSGAPNAADVLRVSFKNALMTDSTVDDLWLDFAVGRAFVGDADDGIHLPESRALGSAGRVTPAWTIAWPDRPRSLTSAAGVAPTGAAYVAIAHASAPPGARLRVEIAWEEHARMRWCAVKIGAAGQELGRIAIPGPDRGIGAQITVVDLDAVSRILLVGTNVGDPSHSFDPDDGVWEPHGWTVTVASE